MSWIVQHLLSNRTRIKESSNNYEKEFRGVNPFGYLESLDTIEHGVGYDDPKLENDEYNNLILVESAINKLFEFGVLTEKDLEVINFVRDGNVSFSGNTGLGRGRVTMSRRFEELCERLAFYMGGYFTNDGFIEHLAVEYNLTTDDVKKIRDFIQSKYRHIRSK